MVDRYAVVGNPIRHSKSPLIHSTFAQQTGQQLTYEIIEPPLGTFNQAVDAFRAAGGRGVNVSTPFKLDAYAYATEPMERARWAGASNCLKFDGDRVQAENFDGVGLLNDIQRNLGFPLRGRRVLLLGAGGAARGVLPLFLQEAPAMLVIANRDVARASRLHDEFARFGAFVTCNYSELAGQSFDIVANATSASLRGELPPVPAAAFAPGCLAYELAYGKGLTPFLRAARDAGAARLADGVGMLVEQAAEAFLWWRGVRPDTSDMIKTLTVPLV
ncbi:MAG TPA: shikimate dehydrogenase [Casimicrobiaceae bacterium]|nr:shikimate dehydrogenase [Casimicrobiaceae bacterium]